MSTFIEWGTGASFTELAARWLRGRMVFVPNGARHLQDCCPDFDDVLAIWDRRSGLVASRPVSAAG